MTLTLNEIADSIQGDLIGDGLAVINGVNSLEEACEGDISFFADPRYEESLKRTRASALLVTKTSDLFKGPQIAVSNPLLAFAKVAGLFAPPLPRFPGISPKAEVHKTAEIGPNASIYPLVYVGKEAVIGENVVLFSGAFIGDRVKIGSETIIHPNVTITHDCVIGKGVIINPGTVIGSDGFGYVRDGTTNVKIPQVGIVQIDNSVEIGANNTIDRAAMGKTWIKEGVKTDNLVHIAHNVTIGRDTIIVAQTALGGSVHIGNEVVIGGQVAIADHVKIENNVMIGSQSGVPKSLSNGEIVSGTPAMPHKLWLRVSKLITRLPQFNERLRSLEKRLQQFEDRLK